jgi:hypothetical protein
VQIAEVNMPRIMIFLAVALLAGRSAIAQKYSGPKCLGPFCVDHEVSARVLLKLLGPPALKKSQFDPYCYQSRDGEASLYFYTIDSEPGVTGAVLLSDFPNCLQMGKRVTEDNLSAWKTPENIKLGSSENDVVEAYGKPSSQEKIVSQTHRHIIQGYRPSDKLPVIAEKTMFYNDPKGDDLSAAEFGIRGGKVSYIWLSHEE